MVRLAGNWRIYFRTKSREGYDYDPQINNEWRLCNVCRVGDVLLYTYDFGDDWQHIVVVEKAIVKPKGV